MVTLSEFQEYTPSPSVVKGLWDSRLRPQRAVSVDNIFSRSSISPSSSSESSSSSSASQLMLPEQHHRIDIDNSNNNNSSSSSKNHHHIHERPSRPHRSSSRYRHVNASTTLTSIPQSCLESSLTHHFNLRQGNDIDSNPITCNNKERRSDKIINIVSRVMRSCTPRRAKSTCMENSYLFTAQPFLSTPALSTESAVHTSSSNGNTAASDVGNDENNNNMMMECTENNDNDKNYVKNNNNGNLQHKWTDSPLQMSKINGNAPLTKSSQMKLATTTTAITTKLSLEEPEEEEEEFEEEEYTHIGNTDGSNRQANGLTDSPSPRIHHNTENHYDLRRHRMELMEEEEQEQEQEEEDNEYAHRLFNSHTPRERVLHSEQDMYHIEEMNIDNEHDNEQTESKNYVNIKQSIEHYDKDDKDDITIISHEPKYAQQNNKKQIKTIEKIQQNTNRVYIDVDDVSENMNKEEQQLQFRQRQKNKEAHNYEEESRETLFGTLQKINNSSNKMSSTNTNEDMKAEITSHQLLDHIKQHQEEQQQHHNHQIISMCRLHFMSNNSSQTANSNSSSSIYLTHTTQNNNSNSNSNNIHVISHTPSFTFKRSSLGNRTPEAAYYSSSSTSAARLRQRQEEQEQQESEQNIENNNVMKKRETIVIAETIKGNHTKNDENVLHTFVQSHPSHTPLAKSLFRNSLLHELSEHDVAPALTVVLDLDETLVSNRSSGNSRAVLRPYCLHFLHALRHMKNIEIVLWTASTKDTGMSVIKQLERGSNIFNEVIFRNSMWFTEPIHTKDLRLLGRPLDRVVIIDNSANCCKLHPRNSILIEEFHGRCSTDDAALVNVYYMIEALLKLINTTNVGVRAGLQKLISEGYLCHSIIFTLPDSWKVLPLSEIAPLKIPPRGKFVKANTLPPSKSIMKYWTYETDTVRK